MLTSRLMRYLEFKQWEIPIVQGYLFLIRRSPESFSFWNGNATVNLVYLQKLTLRFGNQVS
jgi:hypothetical protein